MATVFGPKARHKRTGPKVGLKDSVATFAAVGGHRCAFARATFGEKKRSQAHLPPGLHAFRITVRSPQRFYF